MAVADECSLCNTLAYKFGYGTDIEKFKKEASDKFSLLKDGTLDMPRCARLFLVNVHSPISLLLYSYTLIHLSRGRANTLPRAPKTRSSPSTTTILRCSTAHRRRRGKPGLFPCSIYHIKYIFVVLMSRAALFRTASTWASQSRSSSS